MRSDIAPGGTFPDYELPDHTNVPRKLSDLQGDDPLILTLARGHYCPKEHQQHLELAANYPKIAVAYTQIATIATDEHHTLQEFRASVGAQWPFLADPGRIVQKDLDIQEYTDPDNDPMIPHTLVLKPGLVIHRSTTATGSGGARHSPSSGATYGKSAPRSVPTGTSALLGCARPGTRATGRDSTVGANGLKRLRARVQPRRRHDAAAAGHRRRDYRLEELASRGRTSSPSDDMAVRNCRRELIPSFANTCAQVPFDGSRTDEQLRSDLGVREPVARKSSDLLLLSRQVVARLRAALSRLLARRGQLPARALSEPFHADAGEHLIGSSQLGARVQAAALAAQPFAVEEMGARELDAEARAAKPFDRAAVELLGGLAITQ